MTHKIALPRSDRPAPAPARVSPIVRTFGQLRFRTDGDGLALAFDGLGRLWSLEGPGVLRQWDAATGQALKSVFLSDVETLWKFSDDARLIASASDEIVLWDVGSSEMLTLLQQPNWVTAIALRGKPAILASGHDDGIVRIWDVEDEQVVLELSGHDRAIAALAFSPDGERLAAAGEDRIITIWEMTTGRRLGTLDRHTDRIEALAWHPRGQLLVSAAWDRTARLWDTTSFEPVILLNSHADQVTALAFSPDGFTLASADSANSIHLWDPVTGKDRALLSGHVEEIRGLAFSPDKRVLASIGNDRAIRLWDAVDGRMLCGVNAAAHERVFLGISPGGEKLASTCAGAGLEVWETATGKQSTQLPSASSVQRLASSLDGKWLATSSGDDQIQLWDLLTGQLFRTLEGQRGRVAALAFAPDSRTLASASAEDGMVWLWSIEDAEPILVIPVAADGCGVEALAFDPQAKFLAIGGIDWLATGGSEGAVCLWNLRERSLMTTFRRGAQALAFDPSGRRLASASMDKSICVWDIPGQRLAFEANGHTDRVTSVTYSPSGKWLVSGSDDRTVRLWTAETGQLWTTQEFETAIRGLAFSQDGTHLYTGNGNSTSYQLEMRLLVEAGLQNADAGNARLLS